MDCTADVRMTRASVPGLLNKQAPGPVPGSCPPECPQARSCPACKPSDSVARWGHQGLPVFPFPATCIICLCVPLVSTAGRAGGRPGPGTGTGRDRLFPRLYGPKGVGACTLDPTRS